MIGFMNIPESIYRKTFHEKNVFIFILCYVLEFIPELSAYKTLSCCQDRTITYNHRIRALIV